jgi:hypothetical protein
MCGRIDLKPAAKWISLLYNCPNLGTNPSSPSTFLLISSLRLRYYMDTLVIYKIIYVL